MIKKIGKRCSKKPANRLRQRSLKLLELWDESDSYLTEAWSRIPQERFHAVESAFGLPPGPNRDYILYAVDNEVHHRAQGFVYLRLLGLELPAFWER